VPLLVDVNVRRHGVASRMAGVGVDIGCAAAISGIYRRLRPTTDYIRLGRNR